MKWEKPIGSTQQTHDGRYLVMAANECDFVAYCLAEYDRPQDIGTRDSDVKARGLCEAHEAQLTAAHRRSA